MSVTPQGRISVNLADCDFEHFPQFVQLLQFLLCIPPLWSTRLNPSPQQSGELIRQRLTPEKTGHFEVLV